MDEFSVIGKFFKSIVSNRSQLIAHSIGDDAAIVTIPIDSELVISTDTMVEGVHFLSDWAPSAIAYKLLAVNVSDIAAMAAKPTWCSLALTLPEINEPWLTDFSKGFADALALFNVDLIGGDLTRGPLTLTLTIHGLSKKGASVKRNGAQIGDLIYLTGNLGAPSYAVSQLGNVPYDSPIFEKLFYPKPKIHYASLLEEFANSAIDISDGLASDLSHILKASAVGGVIIEDNLPLDPCLKDLITSDKHTELMLNSGDEYELCFTIPKAKVNMFEKKILDKALPYIHIGQITSGKELTLLTNSGDKIEITPKGFKHF